MEAQITFKDITGVLRRRYKTTLLVSSLILFLTLVIAVVLPPLYKSSAMIMVEEQQIPQDYVKSTITSYAEQRLEMTKRQIMKYSKLKELIEKMGLYPEMTAAGDISGAVRTMTDNIEYETISSKEGTKVSTVAFTLSYYSKDPATAQKVTEELATLYLEEELKSREKQVSVTTDFLKSELESLKQQVQFHEKRISDFKSRHIGSLPENAAMNMQNMIRLEGDLQSINTRLRNLEERKIYLRGQLANIDPLRPVQTETGQVASNPQERLKGLRLDLIRLQSQLSDKHPDVRKLKAEVAELESKLGKSDQAVEEIKALRDKEAKLAELRGRLGSRHPDVITLDNEVKLLSRQIGNSGVQQTSTRISEENPDNPVYINILTQINSAEFEIKSLGEERNLTMARYEEVRSKLDNVPMIEKEYKDLTLDYENAKGKYNDILNKLMSAQVAQQMEEQQKGEKFSILEHAYLPSKPSKPNRFALILLGFVLAAGAGVGFAAIQEGMDHSLKSEQQLAQATGLPVFSSFSFVVTPEERRARRIRKTILAFACVGIFALLLVVFNFVAMPLDELLETIRARMSL